MQNIIRGVINDSWPSLVVLLSIFVIMRMTKYFKGERRNFVIHEEIFSLLFLAYLLILFRLVTSSDLSTFNSTNFIPFREILRYEVGSANFN